MKLPVACCGELHWQAVIAFACAYLAVMVNSLGNLQGIADITDQQRLRTSIRRGLAEVVRSAISL